MWLVSDATPFPGPWTLLPVTATFLLILAGAQGPNVVTRSLSTRTMVMIGDWSYAIYLWHWPFITFARALWPGQAWAPLCAALVSLAPAAASYRWIEQPGRTLIIRSRRHVGGLVAVTVLPPLVIASVVALAPVLGLTPPTIVETVEVVSEPHAPSQRGCMTTGPYLPGPKTECTWNQTGAGSSIYLVGDSTAEHFAEAAIGAGELLDRPVSVFTAPSCPLIEDLELTWVEQSEFMPADSTGADEFAHCEAYVDHTLSWLQQAPSGTVVVSSLDQFWWDPSVGASLGGGPLTTDTSGKAELLRQGLTATLTSLRESGHQVVVVQTVPTYRNPPPVWDPRACTPLAILDGSCSRDVPTDFVDDLQRPSRNAIEKAAESAGASVLDLREWFCTAETCSTEKDGALVYRDAIHITVDASRSLAAEFARAVESS